MNPPGKKKIVIRMSPRVAEDSTKILQNVADAFQDAEVFEVEIQEGSVELAKLFEPVEMAPVPLEEKAIKTAKDTLDLQDRAFREGWAQPDTPEVARSKVRQWLVDLRKQAVKVTVQAISKKLQTEIPAAVDAAVEAVKDTFSGGGG